MIAAMVIEMLKGWLCIIPGQLLCMNAIFYDNDNIQLHTKAVLVLNMDQSPKLNNLKKDLVSNKLTAWNVPR